MRIKCEVCGNLVYLQHPGKNYYRIKHYLGSIDGKLSFEYHKQSLGYITGILDSSRIQRTVDPIDPTTIDPKLNDSNSFLENMAGRARFILPLHGEFCHKSSFFLCF